MNMIFRWLLAVSLVLGWQAYSESDIVKLKPGLVYKIQCSGRLLVSAVGDERVLVLQALPKEAGCGALVKAASNHGQTNIVLETSVQSISKVIEVNDGVGSRGSLVLNWSQGAKQ